jgi:predicted nucleotidyltransferase
MQNTERQVLIAQLRDALLTLYGKRLSGIVLYGSYAREDFNAESDIDFLLILDENHFDYAQEIGRITKVTYPMMLEHDIIISCLPSSLDRWQTEPSFFFDQVKKDGITIWTRNSSAS